MTLERKLAIAENLTNLFDRQFKVGPLKFGLDPLLGLIPGLGDAIPFIVSGYLIYLAFDQKLPSPVIAKMIFYTLVDFLLGSIPVVGDIADFFFRAYSRNYRLLMGELGYVIPSSKDTK